MSANLDLVKTFLEELGCGSVDKALDLLTDEAKWAIAQTTRGTSLSKSELGQRLQMMRASFKDNKLVLTPVSCIENDNRLAVELESSAQTILDVAYRNKYCIIFTIDGGKISDVKEYNDSLHVSEVLVPAINALA
jgi:ketosteroid isomerase-like protein